MRASHKLPGFAWPRADTPWHARANAYECPQAGDLSYYNWDTQTSTSTPTPNFQVIADNEAGLLFKNKVRRRVLLRASAGADARLCVGALTRVRVLVSTRTDSSHQRDRKVINVDPEAHPGDNSARIEISDPKYLQVVLFDHVTRRRP